MHNPQKDFDYVEMSDYRNDMDELSQQDEHIIKWQVRQIKNLQILVGALIEGAGGEVIISQYAINKPNPRTYQIWRDDGNLTLRFRLDD